MSDVTRLLSLTYGINASNYTVGTAPGTFAPLLPRSAPATLFPRSRAKLERPLYSSAGISYAAAFGAKDLAAVTIPLQMTGVNNNTGAAVAGGVWETKMEAGNLLSSIFGASAAATAGAAPTVSSASGTSLTASTNVLQNLDLVMVPTTVGNEIRSVVSGGGTTSLVLSHPLLGTGSAGATIIRGARYSLNSAQTVHTPIWFDCEGENWRRRYRDCQPSSLTVNIPNTGIVEADFAFMPNDWEDLAEANPAYVAPTTGLPVVSAGSTFFIGGTNAFMLRNARLTVNIGMTMRESTTGANGVVGGLAVNKSQVMLEGELYVGNTTGSVGNIVDDTGGTPQMENIFGDQQGAGALPTLFDIMLSVGSTSGASIFIQMPYAEIRSTGVTESGPFAVLPFQAMAGSVTGPMTFGVF